MSIVAQREVGAPTTASGWMDESGGSAGGGEAAAGGQQRLSDPSPASRACCHLLGGPWAGMGAGMWCWGAPEGLLRPSPVVAGEV